MLGIESEFSAGAVSTLSLYAIVQSLKHWFYIPCSSIFCNVLPLSCYYVLFQNDSASEAGTNVPKPSAEFGERQASMIAEKLFFF